MKDQFSWRSLTYEGVSSPFKRASGSTPENESTRWIDRCPSNTRGWVGLCLTRCSLTSFILNPLQRHLYRIHVHISIILPKRQHTVAANKTSLLNGTVAFRYGTTT